MCYCVRKVGVGVDMKLRGKGRGGGGGVLFSPGDYICRNGE